MEGHRRGDLGFMLGGLGVWACRILNVSQQQGLSWAVAERGRLAEAGAEQ